MGPPPAGGTPGLKETVTSSFGVNPVFMVKSTIKGPDDLKGKTFATRLGSSGELFVQKVRDKYKLPNDAIKLINLEPTDMVAVLEACRIQVAAVGGLSLGGFMSLDFHRTHPDRVRCLLLFDTGPGFNKDESRQAWNDYARRTADRLERDGTAALSSSPEVARATANVTGLAHAARGMLTQQDASVIISLRDITVPTLVLVGADDTNFLAAADYMATAIRHAEKVTVPGAGHAANIDQPSAFNDAVVDFLARHA